MSGHLIDAIVRSVDDTTSDTGPWKLARVTLAMRGGTAQSVNGHCMYAGGR